MKKFRALILSTMMAILAFVGVAHIGHAAENDDEKFTITNVSTSATKVENGGTFEIEVTFEGNNKVKPGDKLVIPLPKGDGGSLQTNIYMTKHFDASYQGETIKDVGIMSLEGDHITLTFTDNITKLPNGFSGITRFMVMAIGTADGSESGHITIPGDSVTLPGGATFPDITIDTGTPDDGLKMTKTGRYTADGQLEWTVGVDVSRELLDKAGKDGALVITDKLGYDLPINWDSLQVKAGWMIINEEMMNVIKDSDNKGFTIRIPYSFLDYAFNFNDVDPLHITITYQAGEMEDLVDGMTYDNVANASLGGASASANADYTYHIAGSGGIDGDSSSTVESTVSTDETTDTTTTESAVSSDVEESTTDSTTDVASSDLPTTTTSTTDAEESTSTEESTSDSSTSTTEVTSSDLPTTATSTSADIELPVVSDSTDVTVPSDSTETTETTSESNVESTDTTSSTLIDSSNDNESTTDSTTNETTVSTSDDIINLPINKVTSDSSTDTTTESTTSTSGEEDSEDPEDPNKEDSTEPTIPTDVTTDDEVSDDEVSDEEAAVIVTDKKVDTTTKKVESTTKSNNKNDQDLPQTGTEQSVLLVVMGMGCILLGGYLLKKRN